MDVSRFARAASGLIAIFSGAMALQFMQPARGDGPTVSAFFPGLGNLSASERVEIKDQWVGLAPYSPTTARFVLSLRDDRFAGEGTFEVGSICGPGKGAATSRSISVPRDAVGGFLAAAGRVALVEARYEPRITHTDDYPSFSLAVPAGQGPLLIRTTSQAARAKSGGFWERTPWAIEHLGRTFVVTATDLDQALMPLEPYLQVTQVLAELRQEIEARAPNNRGRFGCP